MSCRSLGSSDTISWNDQKRCPQAAILCSIIMQGLSLIFIIKLKREGDAWQLFLHIIDAIILGSIKSISLVSFSSPSPPPCIEQNWLLISRLFHRAKDESFEIFEHPLDLNRRHSNWLNRVAWKEKDNNVKQLWVWFLFQVDSIEKGIYCVLCNVPSNWYETCQRERSVNEAIP